MSKDAEDDSVTAEAGGQQATSDATQITSTPDSQLEKTQITSTADPSLDKTQITHSGDDQSGSFSAKAAPSDSSNEVIKDRFELIKVLGRGGMGAVYKALDLRKQEAQDREPYVALKLLNEDFAQHPEAFISLQREARKSQTLAHPNIVTVYDFDREGDRVFMTMEFLQGEPLDELLARYKDTGLERDEALKILRDMAAALSYAHEHRIAHSDFKPGNVFVTERNTKVLDFGIARAVAAPDADGNDAEQKTVFDPSNLGALTPSYASLEMLEGEKPETIDDVYALGVVAYELFSGQHPFGRLPANAAAEKGLKPKRIPGLSRKEWAAIERALAFTREQRAKTVDEIVAAFDPPRRGLIAAGLVVVAIFSGALFYTYQQIGPEVDTEALRADVTLEVQQQQARDIVDRLMTGDSVNAEWSQSLDKSYSAYTKIASEGDPWHPRFKNTLMQRFLDAAQTAGESEKFDVVSDVVARARQWQDRLSELSIVADESFDTGFANLEAAVDEFREAQEAAQKEREAKLAAERARESERRAAQQYAAKISALFATVESQVACGSGFSSSKLVDAVAQLRKLVPGRFAEKEPELVRAMVACVKRVARSKTDSARKLKALGIALFPGAKLMSSVKVDPCAPLAAGSGARGSRYVCRDILSGGGVAPSLVVVPGLSGNKALVVGRHEVSNAEWGSFCKSAGACAPPRAGGMYPATGIDTELAKRYVQWLSRESGFDYRIPSYREWLHVARAGTGKEDPNRNCTLNAMGVRRGASLVKVSLGAPNTWGLINVVGNAREMALDGAATVLAGGRHTDPVDRCHIGNRDTYSGPDDATGLRVIRNLYN